MAFFTIKRTPDRRRYYEKTVAVFPGFFAGLPINRNTVTLDFSCNEASIPLQTRLVFVSWNLVLYSQLHVCLVPFANNAPL